MDETPEPVAPAITPDEAQEARAQRAYGDPLLTTSERKALRKKAYVEMLSQGMEHQEAADAIGVDRATVFRWRQHDPEFLAACRSALAVSVNALISHAEKRAFRNDKVLMWLLERRDPDQFHLTEKVEHSGAVDLAATILEARKRLRKGDEQEEGSELC